MHFQKVSKCVASMQRNSPQSVVAPLWLVFKENFWTTTSCRLRRKKLVASPEQIEYIEKMNMGKGINAKKLLDNAETLKGDEGVSPLDIWHSDPYSPSAREMKRQQQGEAFSAPSSVDSSNTSIILFPGQGTQFVGMGQDLVHYPNVKEMYDAASEILQYDLLKLSRDGPLSDLSQTKYQQPAILVASLATIEKLRCEQPSALESCVATAGFSIGEITALTFAGSFTFENAVRLVKLRAEAMHIASEMVRSGMMTVFYGPDSRLEFACSIAKEYCQKNGIDNADCRIASYLHPNCKVVAGNEEALNFIVKNKEDFRLKRIKRLNVSGAFHTDLMKPAAFAFSEALKNMNISKPVIPVYSNVDGKRYKNSKHILFQLPKQIWSPVKWEQTLHTLFERPTHMNFPQTYECGPGSSLKTILKMVNRKAWEQCVSITA